MENLKIFYSQLHTKIHKQTNNNKKKNIIKSNFFLLLLFKKNASTWKCKHGRWWTSLTNICWLRR